MYNIGTHYFSGRGVELDMKKAAEFFKKAADLGFGLAQVFLYFFMLGFLRMHDQLISQMRKNLR